MAENILNARIKLKYDTYANWETVKNTFKPLAGEVILYQIPAQQTDTGLMPPTVGVKVGNGVDYLKDLPWIQAVAGDVYSWAKQSSKPNYTANEIGAQREDIIDQQTVISNPTVEAWLQSLTDEISSLSGGAGSISAQINSALNALDVSNVETDVHHITGFGAGKTLETLIETNGYISATFQDILIAQNQVSGLTSALSEKAPLNSPNLTGTPTAPTAAAGTNTTQIATTAFVTNAIAGLSGAMHYIGAVSANPTTTAPSGTFSAGDVVTYNNSEYVYDGTAWRELGTEGDYAIKGSIRDADIANDANIAQSKISGLTTALAEKAPLANPTFTGTVTVPTPANNTDAATKAYVDTAAASANTTYNISWSATGANAEKLVLTPTTNGVSGTQQTVNLKKVATTADIYDLENAVTTTSVPSDNNVARTAKYFVWDCGDATHLVD